jgi:hypothetical protein
MDVSVTATTFVFLDELITTKRACTLGGSGSLQARRNR